MKQRVVLAASSKSKQRSLVKKSLWVAKTPSKGPNTAQCQKLVYQRSHFTTLRERGLLGHFSTTVCLARSGRPAPSSWYLKIDRQLEYTNKYPAQKQHLVWCQGVINPDRDSSRRRSSSQSRYILTAPRIEHSSKLFNDHHLFSWPPMQLFPSLLFKSNCCCCNMKLKWRNIQFFCPGKRSQRDSFLSHAEGRWRLQFSAYNIGLERLSLATKQNHFDFLEAKRQRRRALQFYYCWPNWRRRARKGTPCWGSATELFSRTHAQSPFYELSCKCLFSMINTVLSAL